MPNTDSLYIFISFIFGASGTFILLLFIDRKLRISFIDRLESFMKLNNYIYDIEILNDAEVDDAEVDDVEVDDAELADAEVDDAELANAEVALVNPSLLSLPEIVETPRYIFERIYALPIWLQFLYFIDNDNIKRAILKQLIINEQCFIINHFNLDSNGLIKTHDINKKSEFNIDILGRIPKILKSIQLSMSDHLIKLYWDTVDAYYSKLGKFERVESDIIDMNQLVNNLMISMNLVSTTQSLSLLEFEYYKYINLTNSETYIMINNDNQDRVTFLSDFDEIALNNNRISENINMNELYDFYYEKGGIGIAYTLSLTTDRQDINNQIDIELDSVILLQYYNYSGIRGYMCQYGLDVEYLLATSNNNFMQNIKMLLENNSPEITRQYIKDKSEIDDGITTISY